MSQKVKMIALLSLALTPVAQAVQQATDSVERVSVVAKRADSQLNSNDRSVEVISQEDLSLLSAQHIQQALNNTSGVNIHRNSGQEMLLSIRSPVLTGAGACGEFLTMENGIPLRPVGLCNVNELFESHFEQAASVEVVKGASTEFFGSNGIHGAINVNTPLSTSENGKIGLILGDHQLASLRLNHSQDDWQVAATATHFGGFRQSSGYDQQKLTLSHSGEEKGFTRSSFVTLFNLDQQTAGFISGEEIYKDSDAIKQNPNPDAYRKASGIRAYQHYDFASGLRLSPYFRHSNMTFKQHFLPGTPLEETEQTSIGLQAQKGLTLSAKNKLVLGWDNEIANLSLIETQQDEIQGSAFLAATVPVGKHYDFDVLALTTAGFLTYQYQPRNNINIETGLRAEYTRYDYDNNMLTGRTDDMGKTCGFGGCRFSRPADSNDSFFNVAPKLRISYRPNTNHALYFAANQGFRVPQITELYRLQRAQTVADLDPVKINGVDAGWLYANNGLEITASLYYAEKRNSIIRNTDFFNISGAKTSHTGVEVSWTKPLSEHWQLSGNASYSRHQYENNPGISDEQIIGNDMDTAPRQLANIFLDYRADKLSARLHWHLSGDYYTDVENQYSYDGHQLLHAQVSYQMNDALNLSVQINNLTNKAYASRADFSSFSGERYLPGRPRNIQLSLNYSY